MPTNQKEIADFIHTMISELAGMAKSAKLDSLSYILEVAQHEAGQAVVGGAAPATTARASPQRSGERKSKRVRKRAA
jgi:hypothetical protein